MMDIDEKTIKVFDNFQKALKDMGNETKTFCMIMDKFKEEYYRATN